jgi:hypothetical protein
MQIVTQSLVGEGGVNYTNARKQVPERRPSLHSSEKEVLEWRSSTFHHKVTLVISNINLH